MHPILSKYSFFSSRYICQSGSKRFWIKCVLAKFQSWDWIIMDRSPPLTTCILQTHRSSLLLFRILWTLSSYAQPSAARTLDHSCCTRYYDARLLWTLIVLWALWIRSRGCRNLNSDPADLLSKSSPRHSKFGYETHMVTLRRQSACLEPNNSLLRLSPIVSPNNLFWKYIFL